MPSDYFFRDDLMHPGNLVPFKRTQLDNNGLGMGLNDPSRPFPIDRIKSCEDHFILLFINSAVQYHRKLF